MGKSNPIKPPKQIRLAGMSDHDLVKRRAALEVEMRRRELPFNVGPIGEKLVINYFNSTPGLPNMIPAPTGTKNVDAISREGDRYSIKTVWYGKKTGTVYPDDKDKDKQLFEFLLVAQLDNNLSLKAIYQFTWEQFTKVRSWDKRMNAWYIGCSTKNLEKGKNILVNS